MFFLRKPLTKTEILKHLDKDNRITFQILLFFRDILDGLEALNDYVEESLMGTGSKGISGTLSDITYKVVGSIGEEVVVEVSAVVKFF